MISLQALNYENTHDDWDVTSTTYNACGGDITVKKNRLYGNDS